MLKLYILLNETRNNYVVITLFLEISIHRIQFFSPFLFIFFPLCIFPSPVNRTQKNRLIQHILSLGM